MRTAPARDLGCRPGTSVVQPARSLRGVVHASIKDVAEDFCRMRVRKRLGSCRAYCMPKPPTLHKAAPSICVLQQYTDWMKGLLIILPDGRYEVTSFAVYDERNKVCVYGASTGHIRVRVARARPMGKTPPRFAPIRGP
jgi:hypothetical protein